MPTSIGLLHVQLYLPEVISLKQKHSIIRSINTRLQKQFNISIAEVDFQDVLQSSEIAITCVSNARVHNEKVLQNVIKWLEKNLDGIMITGEDFEYL